MRSSLWTGLIVLTAGCTLVGSVNGPRDSSDDGASEATKSADNGPGVLFEVNTRDSSLSAVRASSERRTSARGPSLSLLDGEAVGVDVSNYSVSSVGAYTPGMVRIRFAIRLNNRLSGIALAPPGSAPSGSPEALMLIPFLQQADAGSAPIFTGSDASVIVDREQGVLVRPSDDWSGGGTPGSEGYDFAQGKACLLSTPGCSRWEAFPPLAPGAASPVQVVGFDVAPEVGRFRVRLLVSAKLTPVDGGATVPPLVVPGTFTGIPYGAFHLPVTGLGAVYSGMVRTVQPGELDAMLDSVARAGGRVALAVSRQRSRNADETFNLAYWRWEIDRYRAAALDPYLKSGTIIGMYIVDEPDCAECWGGQEILPATVDEMAAYVKSIWPDMVTIARVVPSWFDRYGPPRSLDAVWAQYEGPLHVPSAGQTPAQFQDTQVADAVRLRLGLVFGANVLDGGDGSSGIRGTIGHDTRFQMTAAEYEAADTVFAASPYGCALLDWRYSVTYADAQLDPSALAQIQSFSRRNDVLAASTRIATVARSRAAVSCRQR